MCRQHYCDNQGLCHYCGIVMEPDWYAHYLGTTMNANDITINEARTILGLSRYGVHYQINVGNLTATQHGRDLVLNRKQVTELAATLKAWREQAAERKRKRTNGKRKKRTVRKENG